MRGDSLGVIKETAISQTFKTIIQPGAGFQQNLYLKDKQSLE